MKSHRILVLLAAFGAGLSAVLHAATPFRLFEIAATRFTRTSAGGAELELGLLDANGTFRVSEKHLVAAPPRTQEEAYGKLLVSSEAWFAFQTLGSQALANFERVNQGLPIVVADIPHYAVAPHPTARLAVGNVVNLSTRGLVGVGATPSLVGGFVIEGQPRRVLVRAIGPSLAQFGITDALADPHVTLHRNTVSLHANGNWDAGPDAAALSQASQNVGAFPLATGSKDAALLVELPPGNYTASVVSESAPATGGTALLEIYILPY